MHSARLKWNALFGSRGCQHLLAYGVVPLLVGYCVISRAFQGDGFLPIDTGDEPAETFIQVPLAHAQLAAGDLPKINLYNNFGTPILGEPVVYPFALHALSYALFRPVVAMLVNKFVLAALSMVVLTAFFARYFPPLIGSFCAFLTFSSPAFFYFFQNHPHQGALFYYGLVLLALRRFIDGRTAARGLWLYAACLLFDLSVGINGAVLGTAFVGVYALLLAGRSWKALAWALGLWAAAAVAVYPHFAEFIRLAAASARKDLDYQTLTLVAPWEFIKGIFFRESRLLQSEMFYSAPLIALIAAGLVLAVWKRHAEPDRPFQELRRLLFILGLAPCLAVIACRLYPELPARVPLLKAMNISRVLWFSDVFLLLGTGLAVHAIYQAARAYPVVWIVPALICMAMRYPAFHGQTTYSCVNESYTRFQPESFLPNMKPYTRLAALFDPYPTSQDTKVNQNDILGSAGRSIILDKAFRDYLLRRKLIALGYHGMTYFFLPKPPEVLARFGIRYCLTSGRDDHLAEWGWRPLVLAQDAGLPVYALYGNPVEVTPLYVNGPQPEFLQHYRVAGNLIEAELPAKGSAYEVIASFIVRPGWKAVVNGKRIPVKSSEEHFIQVQVEPSQSAQKLRLAYEPYSNAWLLGCVVISLGGAGLLCWRLGKRSAPKGDDLPGVPSNPPFATGGWVNA
jgi:hypothetical protein